MTGYTDEGDDCPSCGPRLDAQFCGVCGEPADQLVEIDGYDEDAAYRVCRACAAECRTPLVHEDHRVSARIVVWLVPIGLLGLLAWALWAVVFP